MIHTAHKGEEIPHAPDTVHGLQIPETTLRLQSHPQRIALVLSLMPPSCTPTVAVEVLGYQ